MKALVQAIVNHAAQTEGVRYSATDWGQLDLDRPAVKFPAVLTDITRIEASHAGINPRNLPKNTRILQLEVQLTVADYFLGNTTATAPQQQQERALQIWDVIEALHRQFHGWQPLDNTGKMTHVSTVPHRRTDGIVEYAVTYSLIYYDLGERK